MATSWSSSLFWQTAPRSQITCAIVVAGAVGRVSSVLSWRKKVNFLLARIRKVKCVIFEWKLRKLYCWCVRIVIVFGCISAMPINDVTCFPKQVTVAMIFLWKELSAETFVWFFFCLVFFCFVAPAEISNCWKRLQIWLKG